MEAVATKGDVFGVTWPRLRALKARASKMLFAAFWDHSRWKIVEFLMTFSLNKLKHKSSAMRACHEWTQTFHKVKAIQCTPKIIVGSCSDAKRVKMAEKLGKKRLVKQGKYYLSLARKSFKNRENTKWKQVDGNVVCLKKVKLELGLKNEDAGQIYG